MSAALKTADNRPPSQRTGTTAGYPPILVQLVRTIDSAEAVLSDTTYDGYPAYLRIKRDMAATVATLRQIAYDWSMECGHGPAA